MMRRNVGSNSPFCKVLAMANLTLYHASPSRSQNVLWMLEEVGEPYDIKLLSLEHGDQLKPDYLAINPMGKVPALVHNGVAITEVAAICAYLADEFPQAKLNIPVGTPRRGVYLKWLFFAPSVMEPAANDKMLPRRRTPNAAAIGYRDLDAVLEIVAQALTPGPWLMGEQFTAADVVVGSLLRWGLLFRFVPERKEFTNYAARIAARPAVQRAAAKDKELAAPH
jgi:glutathione S-transferase